MAAMARSSQPTTRSCWRRRSAGCSAIRSAPSRWAAPAWPRCAGASPPTSTWSSSTASIRGRGDEDEGGTQAAADRHDRQPGGACHLGWHRAARRGARRAAGQPRPRGDGLLPTVGTKHLDAIVHSGLSTAAALAGRFDVLHYHALGPGMLALAPRCQPGARAVLTVHGLDDERAKWGLVARSVLKTAGWLSARVPDATIVVSRDLQRHYQQRHSRATMYVPNGVVITPAPASPTGVLARLGVEPGRYLVFVGRLVPEKAPDLLLRAFRRLRGEWRLVIVGDSSFTADYVKSLREQAAADPRVVLAGFVYGAELAELYASAACFVLPSLLEGLPLTLLRQ